jgi:hypothetical protein
MVKIKGGEFSARHSAEGAATKMTTEAHEYAMAGSLPVDPSGVVTSAATSTCAVDWQLAQASSTLCGPLSNTTPAAITAKAAFTLKWEKKRYFVRASDGSLSYRIVQAGTLIAEYHVESSELLGNRRGAQ